MASEIPRLATMENNYCGVETRRYPNVNRAFKA
jgi:hypothetical protein